MLRPMRVAEGMTFTALVAGSGFTCGIAAGGTVYCWGTRNALGSGRLLLD